MMKTMKMILTSFRLRVYIKTAPRAAGPDWLYSDRMPDLPDSERKGVLAPTGINSPADTLLQSTGLTHQSVIGSIKSHR